jgi:UDP-N-acetylglucosamine 2-epimerase (hydrolysing)
MGNSSSGVREAGVHGTPAINIGSRQSRRNSHRLIIDVPANSTAISDALKQVLTIERAPSMVFGDGNSARRFIDSLHSAQLWQTPIQKVFHRT